MVCYRRLSGRVKCGFCCSASVCLIGLVLAVFGTMIVDAIIRTVLPMRSTQSLLFEIWQDSNNKQIPLLRNFYVWNLTNPHEVFQRTAIPNFVKIGPYVYREHLYAPIPSVSWSADGSAIHFRYESDLMWDESLSVDAVTGRQLRADDTFTTVNLALWAAAYRVDVFPGGNSINDMVKTGACDVMEAIVNHTVVGRNGFFIQRTVQEYLFGFEDDVWKALQDLTAFIGYQNPSIFRSVFNGSQPAPAPYTFRSGASCPVWDNQSQCNSSASEQSQILSGSDDISKIAQYTQWAGQTSLWWWPQAENDTDASCQTVQGTNAMNYPPGLTEKDTPYVFVDSIFRTVKLQFVQHATVGNIPTLQFRVSDDEKRLGNPNSACYQQRYPATFNMSAPYFAPMIVSQPYFWGVPNPASVFVNEYDLPQGQQSTMLNFSINGTHINDYLPSVSGEDAELVLRVEPHTGALLEGRGRIQLGTWLRPITVGGCPNVFPELRPASDGGPYFPYTMMPVVYLDRTVVAPTSLTDELYDFVILPILLCKIIGGAVAAIAAIVFIILLVKVRCASPPSQDGGRDSDAAEQAKLIQA